MEAAEDIKKNDDRKDLKTQATRYVGALDMECSRPGRMVDIQAFGGAPKDRLEQARRQADGNGTAGPVSKCLG